MTGFLHNAWTDGYVLQCLYGQVYAFLSSTYQKGQHLNVGYDKVYNKKWPSIHSIIQLWSEKHMSEMDTGCVKNNIWVIIENNQLYSHKIISGNGLS